MIKYIMVESHSRILDANENEWPLTTQNNMNESDKRVSEQKKQDTKKYLQ